VKRFQTFGIAASAVVLAGCAAAPAPPSPAASPPVLPAGTGYGADRAQLQVSIDERSRTLLLELGPVDLPPGAMAKTALLPADLPIGAWLTAFDVELVAGNGTQLPQRMLHHVNLMLPERQDVFRPIMQRLVAAGEETERIALPWPFGVPVHRGQRLLASAMLHNVGEHEHRDVSLRMRIEYDRGRRYGVQPFFIDASPPPGPGGWDLPPGRSERVWEGSPISGGRLLGVGGHLHRYGTELILQEVESGRTLVRLLPQMDEDGTVLGVERRTFLLRFGLPLRTDRTYRIIARYDNPTGDTIPAGAMGSIGGMLATGARTWPAADPQHAVYREDVRILIDADGHAGHGHGGHDHD
jgi:hypothetical protein